MTSTKRCIREAGKPMPREFWNVYNYLADRWYELEYGKVQTSERWYQPAMTFLEDFASHRTAR